MDKKIIWVLGLAFLAIKLYAQNGNGCTCHHCKSAAVVEMRNQLISQLNSNYRLKSGTECDKKIVRLNIYYIQDDNGQKNFSATGDGLGNSYNGKDFAYDLINRVNGHYAMNTKLRIPPNNNISINHKDIRFNIEGIYYIKNTLHNREKNRTQNPDGSWSVSETSYSDFLAMRQQPFDSVIHIFIQGVGQTAKELPPVGSGNWVLENTYGGGGGSFGDIIKMGSYAKYFSFYSPTGTNVAAPKEWYWGPEGGLWEHELGHSLVLDHTVLWGWGEPCPTVKFNGAGSVNMACDDNIPNNETPSAWYMTDILNAPIHPGERNGTLKDLHPTWWSNNTMDYNNEHAMSPMQINLMHVFLYQQRTAWLVENAQWTNRNYCAWIGNRISHYGKNITINNTCNPNLRVLANTNRKIIASGSTVIYGGFEVMANGEFEILNTCPKP